MDLKQTLFQIIKSVQEELHKLLKNNGKRSKELGDFGEIFYKEFDQYLSDGGKRIRPFLVKTAFDAVNGDHSLGNIMRASLAIELLHNGSLLHDDVIDKDETRRGKPAYHVIFREFYKKEKDDINKANDFGEAMSIFAGDLCFPFAIESIIQSGFPEERRIKALQAFSEAFREVIDGVIIEIGESVINEGTEETYKKMVNLKTGALIRKSVEIGAILGGGTESQIAALTKYCRNLGAAFQIQDDILGIYGDPEELGKPIGGDIRENKQTILRIYAMNNSSKEQQERLKKLFGKEDLTFEELIEARKIIKETGALDYAHAIIKQSTIEAIQILDAAEPPLIEKSKKLLIALSKYLEERKK
ncbi:MAG: polyprenyl synthetase family protein [Candidatus Heimdallarchaeota archaeon]|nr:polyprenyl synthetase family protein [Candidatus Heimdallarchaeota archaeon]